MDWEGFIDVGWADVGFQILEIFEEENLEQLSNSFQHVKREVMAFRSKQLKGNNTAMQRVERLLKQFNINAEREIEAVDSLQVGDPTPIKRAKRRAIIRRIQDMMRTIDGYLDDLTNPGTAGPSEAAQLARQFEDLEMATDSLWYTGRSRKVENNNDYVASKRFSVDANPNDRLKITHFYVDYIGNKSPKHARLRLITHKNAKTEQLLISYHFYISPADSDENIWSSEYKTEPHRNKEHLTIDLPEEHLQAPFVVRGEFRIVSKSDNKKKPEPKKRPLNYTDPTEKRLKLDFTNFFNKQEYSDVELHCDGKIFYVSRIILSAASAVFDAMFKSKMSESLKGKVDIVGHDPEILELLLKYIYTGKISNFDMQADKLAQIAEYYQVKGLAEECIDTMIRTLSIRNTGERTMLAYSLNNKKLLQACLDYSQAHIDEMV